MELPVLTKSMLQEAKNGQSFRGFILIKEYCEKMTKNNKPYKEGIIQAETSMQFKCWDSYSSFKELSSSNYNGVVAFIEGVFQEYNGSVSALVQGVSCIETNFKPNDFFEKRYDKDVEVKALTDILSDTLSEKGKKLINQVLFTNKEYLERFSTEFAAKGHHDNCMSGLIAHTRKMLELTKWVVGT